MDCVQTGIAKYVVFKLFKLRKRNSSLRSASDCQKQLEVFVFHLYAGCSFDKLPVHETGSGEDGLKLGFLEATFADYGWTLEWCVGFLL